MNQQYIMLDTKKGKVIKKVRKFNKASEFYLPPQAIENLLAHAGSLRNRTIIAFMARCGLRRNEVRGLKLEDIDWSNGWVSVMGKGAKVRTVPMPSSMISDLRLLAGKRTKGFVFLSDSSSYKGKLMSTVSIGNIVRKAGVAAKLSNPNPSLHHINPHLLRHSFARNWLAEGKRKEILRMILGHDSIRTTMDVYGEPTMEEIKKEFGDGK